MPSITKLQGDESLPLPTNCDSVILEVTKELRRILRLPFSNLKY